MHTKVIRYVSESIRRLVDMRPGYSGLIAMAFAVAACSSVPEALPGFVTHDPFSEVPSGVPGTLWTRDAGYVDFSSDADTIVVRTGLSGACEADADLWQIDERGDWRRQKPAEIRGGDIRYDVLRRSHHGLGEEYRVYVSRRVGKYHIAVPEGNVLSLEPVSRERAVAVYGTAPSDSAGRSLCDIAGRVTGYQTAPVKKAGVRTADRSVDGWRLLSSQTDGYAAVVDGTGLDSAALVTAVWNAMDIVPDEAFLPCRQRRDLDVYDWTVRHDMIIARNDTVKPKYVLIGDSITHYWGGEPEASRKNGPDSWEALFGDDAINLGFGWDRIENMLYRMYHGELEGISPEEVFIMAGTNNYWRNTPAETAEGYMTLARFVRSRFPQARLHLVLPPLRLEIDMRPVDAAVASLAAAQLAAESDFWKPSAVYPGDKNITDVIDLTSVFEGRDGAGLVDAGLFVDGTHPSAEGYRRIAEVYSAAMYKGI